MKMFAKITDGALTTTCAAEEDTDLIAQITADGFINPTMGMPGSRNRPISGCMSRI